MLGCCAHGGRYCARCLRYALLGLEGPATNVGIEWGRRQREASPRPLRWWPRWAEASARGRGHALAKVAALGGGPQEAEALARVCWEAARVSYLRAGPVPGDIIGVTWRDDGIREWLAEEDTRRR